MEALAAPPKVKVIGIKKGEVTRKILRQSDVEKCWMTQHTVSKDGEASRVTLSFLTWSDALALLLFTGPGNTGERTDHLKGE